MKKELEEEGPKAKIHHNSLRATFKKVPNFRILGHDSIHG